MVAMLSKPQEQHLLRLLEAEEANVTMQAKGAAWRAFDSLAQNGLCRVVPSSTRAGFRYVVRLTAEGREVARDLRTIAEARRGR